jgi:hypothetical protein
VSAAASGLENNRSSKNQEQERAQGKAAEEGVSYTIRPRIERGKKNAVFVVYFYERKDNQHGVLG